MENMIIKGDTLVELLFIPIGITTNSIIPQGIRVLGEKCFYNKALPEICVVPEGVEIIDRMAFFGATNVKKIILPSTIKFIGDYAFAKCESLQSIEFNSNFLNGRWIFNDNNALQEIIQHGHKFRVFYFELNGQSFIARQDFSLSTSEYDIYNGIFITEYFPTGKIESKYNKIYLCYIRKNNKDYIFYNPDLQIAITGCKFFASGKSYKEYFNKTFSMEDSITVKEFYLLTGICYEGVDWFLRRCKYSTQDQVPIVRVMDFLGVIEHLFPASVNRIKYCFEHQEVPTHLTGMMGFTCDNF